MRRQSARQRRRTDRDARRVGRLDVPMSGRYDHLVSTALTFTRLAMRRLVVPALAPAVAAGAAAAQPPGGPPGGPPPGGGQPGAFPPQKLENLKVFPKDIPVR